MHLSFPIVVVTEHATAELQAISPLTTVAAMVAAVAAAVAAFDAAVAAFAAAIAVDAAVAAASR